MPDTTIMPTLEAPQRVTPAPQRPFGAPVLRPPTRERELRLGDMLGRSPAMRELFRRLQRASHERSPVLLEGETGAGKFLAARTLHDLSHPPSALFLTLDPADAAGFGGGPAENGTLYVDEVAELSPASQLELWQVLDAARSAGLAAGFGRRHAAPRLRVVCATVHDLRAEVERGRFRADLWRLLRAGAIPVPSLRDRREDVPLLVGHFLAAACRRHERRVPGVHPDALQILLDHPWEGNVRELRNEIERAVLLTPDGEEVRPSVLSPDLAPTAALAGAGAGGSLRQRSRELEKKMVEQALARNGWNVAATARELGISRVGLSKKLRVLEMRRPLRRRTDA